MSNLQKFLQVDIGDLPPLFSRPRRSPKLNPDSRQASLLGGLGAGSRRQSSVPRPLVDAADATSQNNVVENNSSSSTGPAVVPPARSLQSKRIVERSPLYLTDDTTSSSRKILDDDEATERDSRAANIKLALDDLFLEGRPYNRKNNRVLSTIASSSTTSDYPSSQHTMMRESRSLDAMSPEAYSQTMRQQRETPDFCWQKATKKTYHSLEGCNDDVCPAKEGKIVNNNYPNGNVVIVAETESESSEEADMPLLEDVNKEGNVGELMMAPKRWRSLDQVMNNAENNVKDKKSTTTSNNSPWNWLAKIFNGNGLRNSNISLRRDVIAGYDLQSERESIV